MSNARRPWVAVGIVAACIACCAAPLWGVTAALGIGSAVGLMAGGLGGIAMLVAAGIASGVLLWHHWRGRRRCESAARSARRPVVISATRRAAQGEPTSTTSPLADIIRDR